MNIVLVLIDSLNRQALSFYGDSRIRTPNLDAFAARAWRFDNHFVGSLPCMPARREIFAGFKEVMWRPWGPLEPFDARLPKLLEAHGLTTAMVTDHYHYWEAMGNGYMQSFQSVEIIRGHESDFWRTPIPADAPIPAWVQSIERWRPGSGRRYYANVKDFRGEEDFFPAKVMTAAAAWLRANARTRPFFLQVESFDVHEPFHVPEPYASMYGDWPEAETFTVWPPYQNMDRQAAFMAGASPRELAYIRARYAGKLSMVDRWFGDLVREIDRLRLWDDTMVVVTTDHGHDLGERGVFAKSYPHWDSHANIPLLVWHPQHPGRGRSVSALTSTVDLFASVLDAAGTSPPHATHGRSFVPLLAPTETGRRGALFYGSFGQGVCCTDGEWTLFKSPERDEHLHYYSSLLIPFIADPDRTQRAPLDSGQFIPNVRFPQWRIPTKAAVRTREDFLFHRRDDPGQTRNLWQTRPGQRDRMLGVLRDLLEAEGAPREQFLRLGLSS